METRLAHMRFKEVRSAGIRTAVLPWGATEAHNLHLPYGTDTIQCEAIVHRAATRAAQRGAKLAVLPAVPFGVQTAQIETPFNINMMPSTQLAVLRDVVQSLDKQGIEKLVIVNGHGGNHFTAMVRELYGSHKLRIFLCNWYDFANAKEYFEEPGDHGGEMETSVMMHLVPELVLPLSEAGAGQAKRMPLEALQKGWAWTQRDWLGKVTEDAGVGNPAASSSDNGRIYLEVIVNRISDFLIEVEQLDVRKCYV